MSKADATDAQLRILKLIRKEFGKAAIGTNRVDQATRVMRVELKCEAGLWHWWYNAAGEPCGRALHRTLPGAG